MIKRDEKGGVNMIHFYYHDEDRELSDEDVEKPSETKQEPIVISPQL